MELDSTTIQWQSDNGGRAAFDGPKALVYIRQVRELKPKVPTSCRRESLSVWYRSHPRELRMMSGGCVHVLKYDVYDEHVLCFEQWNHLDDELHVAPPRGARCSFRFNYPGIGSPGQSPEVTR